MQTVRFREFGEDLKFSWQAEQEDYAKLNRSLKRMERDSVGIFDLNGLEFLGYSYAKQTIRRCFRRLLEGDYRIKTIVLKYDRNDYEDLLDGVRAGLAEQDLTMWLSVGTKWIPFGYLSTDGEKEAETEKRKKAKMKDILVYLRAKRECATNEISDALDLSLQNANHLLQELAKMRLLERSKVSSPTGGPLFVNRMVAM